jgi:16S rRNA (guanine966-N2)-methyltransferase
VVAGAWRGRVLRFRDVPGLRPTPDRVRETLFNWLGQDLTGRRCLDLFAGSGALGIEALSRNAAHVTFVEQSREEANRIGAMLATLREGAAPGGLASGTAEVRCCDALEFLASRRRTGDGPRYDVVFLDPPFASGLLERALDGVAPLVAPGGVVYVEAEARLPDRGGWRIRREGRAGTVRFGLLVPDDEPQGSEEP